MQSPTKKVVLLGCSVFGSLGLLAAGVILWLLFSATQTLHTYTAGSYKVSWGKVYFYQPASGFTMWQSWEITEADAASFEILEDGYAKDKNYAYVDSYLLSQSESRTFKITRKPYAADQNHVFYERWRITKCPEKFRIMKKGYSANGEKAFSEGKDFLPGTVDARTFEQVGSSDFFKNKNRVYVNEQMSRARIQPLLNIFQARHTAMPKTLIAPETREMFFTKA